MPSSKLARIGVWEDGKFIGAVIYGCGATPEIGKPFGLEQNQLCELVRVALTDHTAPTSKVVAISLRMIRKAYPGLKLVVSFADTSQGHEGTIYQAGNWLYVGSKEYHAYRVHDEVVHPRSMYERYGVGGQSVPWLRANVDPHAERIKNGVKRKYLYLFDDELRQTIKPLPYPKHNASEVTQGDTTPNHGVEGGSLPTPTL